MNWKLIRIIDAYAGIPLVYAALWLKRLFRSSGPSEGDRTCGRILLVKFWGIGNLFMMLPSVGALRSAYPDAEIDILTLETNRSAAEYLGVFDHVYTVDTKGYLRFIGATFSMFSALRRREYDRVIDFEQFARYSAVATAVIGSKVTVGFMTSRQHRHLLYSHPVAYDNNIHITRSYCSLARAAGADCAQCDVSFFLPSARPSDAGGRGILGGLGVPAAATVIVMHVGTSDNFSERRWPTSSYAALADLLAGERNVRIVLTGLKEEAHLAAEVRDLASAGDRIFDASGTLTFEQYDMLIRASALVVSADTAAVHIASAAGIPVVGLYGPNTPVLYGPWGRNGSAFYKELDCSPCITNFNAKTHRCRHPEGKGACMRAITPGEVYQEICKRYLAPASAEKSPGGPVGKKSCVR